MGDLGWSGLLSMQFKKCVSRKGKDGWEGDFECNSREREIEKIKIIRKGIGPRDRLESWS